MNPSFALDQRVDDLVSRLTMEEKAAQMVNQAAAIPRLQVPAYNWWNEALHGVVSNNVTVFTQVIGLGATFNAPLIKHMSTVISTEARARYNQALQQQQAAGAAPTRSAGLDFWAPNINIFRDPRWGRGQETYGEDPFLTGRMAVNFVQGMQGDDPKYFRTISTPKHFAVHSGPEPTRHFEDVSVSLHDEDDTYLPAFRAALVEAKADSVMCAYNRINGEPACASKFLLQDTLRGAWHFNGYVVSDCGAISDISNKPGVGHHIVNTLAEAAALSMKTGMDSDCAMSPDVPAFLEAMQKGLISQSEVDVNLKRLFRARFQLGMFDPPDMVPYSKISPTDVDTPEHRALALSISRQAMVLLKNDGALPLKSSVKTIAVVGPLADNDAILRGNYSGTSSRYTTIIDGIRKQFSGATVTYTPGTKFQRNAVTVPNTAFKTSGGQPGVDVVYFNNKTLTGQPVASRVEQQIGSAQMGFQMGGGGGGGRGPGGGQPASSMPTEVNASGDFSGRWTATLTPPETGKCEFTINGNGGVRVTIDGKQIINDWVQRAPAGRGMAAMGGPGLPERTAEASFEKGKTYKLVVEFFRDAAAATAQTNASAAANAAAAAAAATFGGGGRGFNAPVTGPTLSWIYGYDQTDAVNAAKNADVVIAVVGITSQLEGEQGNTRGQLPEGFEGGDRTSLDLPKDEETLLEAVKATGKPLIVTLVNGSALSVNWADQNANAILETWYPGEDGGQAVAETLAGVNNPAGRLPVTFYKGLADLTPFNDYNMTNRTYRYYTGTPLYPFGYGLSYSKFEYSNLKLSTATLQAGSDLTVEADVKNASSIAGDEVAQLYLVFPRISGAPLRAMRGFQRINIPAGQTTHVTFTLNPRDLSCVTADGETHVAPGAYTVFVGGGQPNTKAPGQQVALTIQGEQKLPR